MKIGIAQQNYRIGDFSGNFEKIKTAIEQGIAAQADLLLFSELSVCGIRRAIFWSLIILFANASKQCSKLHK